MDQAARAVAAWHAAWALGVGIGVGLLLTFLDHIPAAALGALACGASPGLLGWLLKPRNGNGVVLLVLWAIACAFALALTGGVSGPLMAWAAGPILAGAALGGLWRDGATLSFATLAGVALIQANGGVAPAPTGAVGFGLGLVGLATILGGASAALMLFTRSAPTTMTTADTGARPGDTAAQVELSDLRARLAQAETDRDAAQGQVDGQMRFVANMSHELRTPLNAVMGFSDIMRARLFGDLPPKYAEYSELIHESGRHLLDLINDVLDMSKITADKYQLARETFDVREAVNASLRILRVQADEAGIRLRGVLPAEALMVDADRRAVKQIVLNLVSNALKFTPAGGSVTVTAQAASDSSAPTASVLELIVSDTGVGIAPEDLERLGQPYEQAGDADQRTQGTGLGLFLVKAFARLHGGRTDVESRLGEGASVCVRLPVLVDHKVAAPVPEPAWIAERP